MELTNDQIKQKNGEVLLGTLKCLRKNAKFNKIVDHVAKTQKVEADQIRPIIQGMLQSGVTHGFLQCNNGNYFVSGDPQIISRNPNSISKPSDCAACRRKKALKRRAKLRKQRSKGKKRN